MYFRGNIVDMETNAKTWTLEEVAVRRAAGDSLVTHGGWCASYDTCPPAKAATLHLERHARVQDPRDGLTYDVVEVDPRDGHAFACVEDAELYALNRGCLVWYRDWKAQQQTAVPASLALTASGKRRRGRNIRKEHAS